MAMAMARPPIATAGRIRSCLRAAGRATGRRESRARPERCVHRRSCARRLEKLVASNGLHQLRTPPPHAARSRSHLGPRRPRSRHAARPRLYRLKSVFKRDHRSSGLLLPAAEQLASSVATEQTGGTTENANGAPVPGPKGTLSSSCVRVRVRAHAGRPLFVLRRPWRPPRGRFAPPYQLATAHHRRRAMPRTRSPRRPRSHRAARPRLDRLKNFFKRGRRPSVGQEADPTSSESPPPNPSDQLVDRTTEEEEAYQPDEVVVAVKKPEASAPQVIAVAMTLYVLRQSEPSSVGTEKVSFEVKASYILT